MQTISHYNCHTEIGVNGFTKKRKKLSLSSCKGGWTFSRNEIISRKIRVLEKLLHFHTVCRQNKVGLVILNNFELKQKEGIFQSFWLQVESYKACAIERSTFSRRKKKKEKFSATFVQCGNRGNSLSHFFWQKNSWKQRFHEWSC